MEKTLKNLVLQKLKADDLETWRAALWNQVQQSFINNDPGLTLPYFMTRLNLVAYAFEWGKLLQSFNGKILQQMTKLTENLCLYRQIYLMGLSVPAPVLYTRI